MQQTNYDVTMKKFETKVQYFIRQTSIDIWWLNEVQK